MENLQFLFSLLNAQVLNSFTIEFNGDNEKKCLYDTDENLWIDNGYFKIINPNNILYPNYVYIFSNINEFLICLEREVIFLSDVLEKNSFIIISSEDSNEKLVEFFYQNIVFLNTEIIVFLSTQNFIGFSNLLKINNLLIKHKFDFSIDNGILNIFNSFLLPTKLNFSTLDKYLKNILNKRISYQLINKNFNNREYKMFFNF